MAKQLELLVTMWPDFKHFERFARDERIAGIRMNGAIAPDDAEPILSYAVEKSHGTPLYLDIKGRQLRVREVSSRTDYCELVINHRIKVDKLPIVTLFKAGADGALLGKITNGNRLLFDRGPNFKVAKGESLHIRDPSLKIEGGIPAYEQALIKSAQNAGVERFMLSYVENQSDIDEFRTYVGKAEVVAKIESLCGLRFARQEYAPDGRTNLMAARGDLYVEVHQPHDILSATRSIVKADPRAIAASRVLLSVTNEPVPSCADFSDLAFLLDSGYRRIMLCDGLCLKEESLERAVNICESFANAYGYELVKGGTYGKDEEGTVRSGSKGEV